MKMDVLKRFGKRGGKALLLAVAVILVVGLAVGMSFAYLTKTGSAAVNEFELVQLECQVNETFENGKKSNIYISVPQSASDGSVGYADAYVRVSVVCNWQDSEGNVVAKFDGLPDLSQLTLGTGWKLGSDGYYYYAGMLKAGEQTEALFTTAIEKSESGVYILNVTIIAEAIQTAGEENGEPVVVSRWAAVSSVADNGDLVITTD